MRNPFKFIWTSSYDRDLEVLLDMWPEIRKQIPEAELTITYGWELFDAAYARLSYNPERMEWKAQMNKKMDQDGITHLGRVGQKKMVELLREHALWTYPTNFDEISCISAMKAQVYGAIPVTTNHAALAETVQFGSKVTGNVYDPQTQKDYIAELVKWSDRELQEKVRPEMIEWAKKTYSWRGVAELWNQELKKPKVYSQEWAKELFESLPEELQKDDYKAYNI